MSYQDTRLWVNIADERRISSGRAICNVNDEAAHFIPAGHEYRHSAHVLEGKFEAFNFCGDIGIHEKVS